MQLLDQNVCVIRRHPRQKSLITIHYPPTAAAFWPVVRGRVRHRHVHVVDVHAVLGARTVVVPNGQVHPSAVARGTKHVRASGEETRRQRVGGQHGPWDPSGAGSPAPEHVGIVAPIGREVQAWHLEAQPEVTGAARDRHHFVRGEQEVSDGAQVEDERDRVVAGQMVQADRGQRAQRAGGQHQPEQHGRVARVVPGRFRAAIWAQHLEQTHEFHRRPAEYALSATGLHARARRQIHPAELVVVQVPDF